MAKGSRGLPDTFSLNVPDQLATRPIQLDDYLDESRRPIVPATSRAPTATPAPPPVSTPASSVRQTNVVSMPAANDSFREALLLNSRPQLPERAAAQPAPKTNRPPPRKQLNMNPETLRMVEELLDMIKRYSGQKDAKASEMFHALVTTLYEAKDLLDLQNIPPRGRWGTPTARAFPVALKNAFQSAVAELYRRRSG